MNTEVGSAGGADASRDEGSISKLRRCLSSILGVKVSFEGWEVFLLALPWNVQGIKCKFSHVAQQKGIFVEVGVEFCGFPEA